MWLLFDIEKKKDHAFVKALDMAFERLIEDAAGELAQRAGRGDTQAITHFLRHNHPNYMLQPGQMNHDSVRRRLPVIEPRPKSPNPKVKGPEPLNPLLPGGL